jgi:heme/copper-type cytochrome/quinol oxidase subunit 4
VVSGILSFGLIFVSNDVQLDWATASCLSLLAVSQVVVVGLNYFFHAKVKITFSQQQ